MSWLARTIIASSLLQEVLSLDLQFARARDILGGICLLAASDESGSFLLASKRAKPRICLISLAPWDTGSVVSTLGIRYH